MREPQNRPPFPLALIATVTVAILATGGGTAWWAWHSLRSKQAPVPTTSQPTPDPTVKQPSQQGRVEVYWLDARGGELALLPSSVTFNKSAEAKQVLETALVSLLKGPSEPTYITTIPQGTKLLGVSLDKKGIHVNLSPEFTTGGGSASMTGRLGQILYTATSLDPKAQVWIDVAGKPLEVLGGEGIMVDQPLTREIFQENFQF